MGESLHGSETEIKNKSLVSIISPVYNEAAVIPTFVNRVITAVGPLKEKYDFEFVLVDDGSRDESLKILKQLTQTEKRLRVIELRRNYGQTSALQAGLDCAKGSIFVTMDSDLQHFPEEIPQFLSKLEEGYDMVCGWRRDRQEGIIRRWPSWVANRLIHRISAIDIHDFGTTYRAYYADLAHDIDLFGEFHRFIPVLGRLAGAKITELPIKNIERTTGKSNYGLGRSFGVLFDLIVLYFLVNYMDRPMRAFGKLAALLFLGSIVIAGFLLGYAFVYHVPTVREHLGWFMLASFMMISSLQIVLSGILAEVLIRIHYSIGGRRVYKVRREWIANNIKV